MTLHRRKKLHLRQRFIDAGGVICAQARQAKLHQGRRVGGEACAARLSCAARLASILLTPKHYTHACARADDDDAALARR